jgi:hypothetical protein
LDFAPETGVLQLKVGHPLAQFADQLVAHGVRQFSSDREPATVCRPGGRGRERPEGDVPLVRSVRKSKGLRAGSRRRCRRPRDGAGWGLFLAFLFPPLGFIAVSPYGFEFPNVWTLLIASALPFGAWAHRRQDQARAAL